MRRFTNRSITKMILTFTYAGRYRSKLKTSHRTVHWSLRLRERFRLQERLKSAESLKRFVTPRLAIRRHWSWLSPTCSRLNYSNETADTVVRLERAQHVSRYTPTRIKTEGPKSARWLVIKIIVKRHIRPQDDVYHMKAPQMRRIHRGKSVNDT